ncbi:PaaI family thioesterase [Lysobacter sp. KIS68-7]|uniref:PaaI family thioesterase n=1 Tax=Lysobacter sp. KIS68-7 TaxID=2904252 RepID=UPI001E39A3CF|nr:PaaI family thioesterase [Lysobacter sp. KIS68-7]UHQ19351.1 PaaI family thioesterase [Lysobacter sp. KIS68-7]
MTPNPAYIEAMQQLVRDSKFPQILGMTLAVLDFDRAQVTVDLDARHTHGFGMVHGGVFATLIDSATWWSAYMRIPETAGLVNVDLKLNYLKAMTGGSLRAEGRCLRAGRQISYAEATVLDERGDLVAHGTSTLMALPDKGLRVGVPKFLEEDRPA